MTKVTGTCQVCEQSVEWSCSTLSRHNNIEGQRCAGSYKKPVEALVAKRPMTPDERRLAKEMFG